MPVSTPAANSQQQPYNDLAYLTRYLTQRSKPSSREQKEKLTAEGHDVLCSKLNAARPLQQRDINTTKENIHGITKKWKRDILYIEKGTELEKSAANNVAKTESLRQYWRQFKMLYDRINDFEVDSNDARDAVQHTPALEGEFGLDPSPKEKPGHVHISHGESATWARNDPAPVDATRHNAPHKYPWEHPDDPDLEGQEPTEDLDDLDDEKLDPKEYPDDPNYNRAQPWDDADDVDYGDDADESTKTKRRYKEICHEDIRLWIVQNPRRGERDLLAMEIALQYHKGADKKPKPTIYLFREEELPILYPIPHILAVALRDDAIKVDERPEGAEPFFTTNLKDPMKAMKVQWKPSKLKVQALRYSTYTYYLDRLGWEAGFEQKLTSYCARRCTGNAVDEATTTAVSDQIMRHDPNSEIFNPLAVVERRSVDGLTRAFTHMSITCDPRAPKNVPKHVKKALPRDPKIVEREKERRILLIELRSRYGFLYRVDGVEGGKKYQILIRKINSATKKWEEDIKKAYRRQYFYRTHNEELQRQLNKVETKEYVEPVIHHQLPERTRLQVETTNPLDTSIEGQLQRFRLQYQRRIKWTNKHEQLAEIPRRLYWANIIGLYFQEKAAREPAKRRRVRTRDENRDTPDGPRRSLRDIYVDFLSQEEERNTLI
ncbi:uncharacterized protein PAC_17951 [Phialocephala subalpina]|uniref:Uncharacterized protein n=1 Tax=Phialocephala subalpina TaxID=576137 RepID=A0A1L7XSN5_9HELO|nr:uncharacterized protein PAC_17951 [Phialocephala subalpina]